MIYNLWNVPKAPTLSKPFVTPMLLKSQRLREWSAVQSPKHSKTWACIPYLRRPRCHSPLCCPAQTGTYWWRWSNGLTMDMWWVLIDSVRLTVTTQMTCSNKETTTQFKSFSCFEIFTNAILLPLICENILSFEKCIFWAWLIWSRRAFAKVPQQWICFCSKHTLVNL